MNEMDYRDYRSYRNYRDDEDDYRDYRNYREDYRRGYDRRGGRRNYRNYREDYADDLEMLAEDMREHSRKVEDVAEMSNNPQEKNLLMKVAQTEKEHYKAMKNMLENHM